MHWDALITRRMYIPFLHFSVLFVNISNILLSTAHQWWHHAIVFRGNILEHFPFCRISHVCASSMFVQNVVLK